MEGGCYLSLSFFLHQQGEQIPQAEMLVLVAAIPPPCLWFTLIGTAVAVICPLSHSWNLVATDKVGVHQVSYQLSHSSGSFPNQLWMQQHCMWKEVRQPSSKISEWQFYTVTLQACTFWTYTLKATSSITWNWWREESRCGLAVGSVNQLFIKKYLQETALQQGASAAG